MRDLQLQTPQAQRDQISANRRPKPVSDLKRNLCKTAKKSLDPAFKAASEDDSTVLESLKEFPEASDDNPFAESTENFLASVHPAETHSSESVAISDPTSMLSSSSTTATPYKHVVFDTSTTKTLEVDSLKEAGSVETEALMKLLREARTHVSKSKDIGPSKKKVEALINFIIQEYHGGLHEEEEWLDKLLFRKSNLVFLMCIMVAFSLSMVWFLRWISTETFIGPPPT